MTRCKFKVTHEQGLKFLALSGLGLLLLDPTLVADPLSVVKRLRDVCLSPSILLADSRKESTDARWICDSFMASHFVDADATLGRPVEFDT